MSKAKDRDSNKDPNAAALKPVALPSLPKIDESQRDKWSADYDKVESELLKPHLGNGSKTVGLRQISNLAFDREVPDPNSEMSADRIRGGRGGGKKHGSKMNNSYGTPKGFSNSAGNDHNNNTSQALLESRGSPVSQGGVGTSPQFSPDGTVSGRARTSSQPQGVTNASSRLPDAPTRGMDPRRVLRVLLTMLQPPVKFRSQCSVDLQYVDLSWLLEFQSGDRMPTLQTLETMRNDVLSSTTSNRNDAALSSPRSTIVMLRNGVCVKHLQERSLGDFLVAHESDQEVAQFAHKHYESRRTKLLDALREEYREMCSDMSLFDLLDMLPEYRDGGDFKIDVTFLQRRAEKQSGAADLNKERGKRQLEKEAEVVKRAAEAERRRRILATESDEKARAKRDEAAKLQEQTRVRMEQLKASANAIAEGIRTAAEEKQRVSEEREKDRLEQRAERLAREKAVSDARNLEKHSRMESNRLALLEQQRSAEKARREKEQALELRRSEGEAKRAKQREHMAEQQAKSLQQRELARKKAAEHDEEVRLAAVKRCAAADSRLQAFQGDHARKREEHRQLEASKAQHQRGVSLQAEQRRSQRAAEIVEKEKDHSDTMLQTKTERDRRKNFEHVLQSLANDDKQFLVERQRRAQKFSQVVSVSSIQEREQRVAVVAKQKEQLMEAARRERERSRLEHELMRSRIQEQVA